MSKLVIVESPAKAKTIGKYLGTDYVVKASMGHLRDLPKKKMSVDIEHDFKPVYMPIEGKEKLIEENWDKSKGALYFESKSESTWHEEHLEYLFKHGDHYFYTEQESEE